jgi:dTDP-4-amino-4,6-dideoxygalactose transaminase
MFGPPPRFRLYTNINSYWSFLRDALLSRLHTGNDVQKLEDELCRRLDVTHAVCVPMARVGIYLTIKSLIKPGADVIMSPYTIADVVNMVIAAGGIPVFADIERRTCNIDPAEVSKLLDSKTGAVLATHLHGISARTFELRDMCEKRGVPLVEDAAQAFGAVQGGKHVGTIGDAGIYSFGMYKNINAWYGGAVVTNNDTLATRIREQISEWTEQSTSFLFKRIRKGLLTDVVTFPPLFRLFTFWVFRYGCLHGVEWINRRVQTELDLRRHDELPMRYQAQLTPFQARLVFRQLERVNDKTLKRIERAQVYHDAIEDVKGIILPPAPSGLENIYSYFPIQVSSREAVVGALMRRNRDVAVQHLKNCAELKSFSEYHRHCANAENAARTTVLLPSYPRYNLREVRHNAVAVRAICDNITGQRPSSPRTVIGNNEMSIQ